MDLKTLRHNLTPRYNKIFVKWRHSQKKNKNTDLHHILGSVLGGRKLNDYLLAEIDSQLHTDITYKRKATEQEFDMMLIDSLEGVFNYIEHLEKTIELLKGQTQ